MRLLLFTDTLGDVNGVSRFIRDAAARALATGRDLRVVTSTRFACPGASNIACLPPVAAARMPGYADLGVVLPPARALLRHARRLRPDAVHVSTPGPVGVVGALAARRLGVPLLGVYHTDFPAFVDQLFDDSGLTALTERAMRFFYGRFRVVFCRSEEYMGSLTSLGIPRERIVALRPGIDTDAFHVCHRDPSMWKELGIEAAVKVLYCGRVSVEKNLPFLARVWEAARESLGDASLVIVGDGPYRGEMQRRLPSARFLGYRHGEELSRIYASSDVFVFPSVTDTLGQAVMEAQASGLPAMVSDRGGPRRVVADGQTGFVLSTGEAGPWIVRLRELCADAERRRLMGAAAHERLRHYGFRESFEHFWSVHEAAVRP